MKLLAVLAFVLAAVAAFAVPGAALILSEPAVPVNVEAVSSTQNSLAFVWGPSQPGPFAVVGGSKSWVSVSWGPSTDTRSEITYAVSRDGKAVANGLTTNRLRFDGLVKLSSFRICVQAHNSFGQASVLVCGAIRKG